MVQQNGAIIIQNLLTNMVKNMGNSLYGTLLLTLIFLLGYLFGYIFRKIIEKLLASIRLQDWLEEQNLASVISAETLTALLGFIVQWSIIALFLAQGTELLGYETLRGILVSIIKFAYSCLFALIIALAGLMVARYIRNFLESSLTRFRKLIAFGAEFLILYMSFVMALKVIPGLDTTLLEWAFIIGFGSIAFAIALAIGVSFGLALKEEARSLITELEQKPQRKKKSIK